VKSFEGKYSYCRSTKYFALPLLLPCLLTVVNFLALFLIFFPTLLIAQPEAVDHDKYPFINYDQNKIYAPDTSLLAPFFGKVRRMLLNGDKQVNIVHIGDSHIQADIFTGKLRQELQDFIPGGNGGRGFVFPYSMAHTNNPVNYKVSYTGKWFGCRNVQYDRDCPLGLAGISVSTPDSFTNFTITPTGIVSNYYDYTHIKLFYSAPAGMYRIQLMNTDSHNIATVSNKDGIIEWQLKEPITEVEISISRLKDTLTDFTITGMELGTDDPGLIYNSVGINGAELLSWLRCQYLEKDLKAINPDLIIISLGTNDAYGKTFNTDTFRNRYFTLLRRIRTALPGVPIILTSPGDNYRKVHKHSFDNENNTAARKAIFQIAKKDGDAVWDFFTVMGGLKSMQTWYSNGLTAKDKVHMDAQGYYLQADLMFEALIASFDDYLGTHKR